MNLSQFKKIDPLSITFILILIYISFINIFAIKTTPEIIILQFVVLLIIFKRYRTKEFLQSWLPLIALFFLYEFLRGLADDFSPFYNYTLYWVYNLESDFFSTIPTLALQDVFAKNWFVISFSLFFYSMFFYYSFLIAFLIWLFKKNVFIDYVFGFLFLTFLSLTIFFLIPTAPPWFVSQTKNLGIERYLFSTDFYNNFNGFSLWNYFLYANSLAAFPSLHVAWPAFTSLFLITYLKNKWLYLLLIIPLMISFSVILTGEHWLIDVIFGWIMAGVSIAITLKLRKRFEFTT